MGVRYSPKIIIDSIEAMIDPFNSKVQSNVPIQNRSNFPTNWVTKRSKVTNVTGTIDPPSELPSSVSVYKLEIDLSTYANTLHRATSGSYGFVSIDPDNLLSGTRYNVWGRGDVNNPIGTQIQCDIGDENLNATGTMTVGASTNWLKLELINSDAGSYGNFFDLSPYGAHGEIVYISGITIAQSNTEILANQQAIINNCGYMDPLEKRGIKPKDMVISNEYWNITETKWDSTSKYYKFDNSGMYIKSNFNTPSNLQGDPDFTVMQIIRRTGTIAGGASWSIGGGASNQGFSSYTGPSGVDNTISFDQWGVTTIYVTGQTYPLDEWVIIHWIKSSGNTTINNLTFYINENKYTDTNLTYNRQGSGTPNVNSGGLTIGRAGAITDAYYVNNADIGATIFYSKVLSDEEVQNNVRIFKSRYGIS